MRLSGTLTVIFRICTDIALKYNSMVEASQLYGRILPGIGSIIFFNPMVAFFTPVVGILRSLGWFPLIPWSYLNINPIR